MKPVLIVVTGRPGSGKTTLCERISREWCLPLVSRDRIKEGFVHTQQKSHDQLPEDGNLIATNTFFGTLDYLLNRDISCIAEAAFQHKLWAERLPTLEKKAQIHIVICHVDAQTALNRFLDRGLNDAARLRFHGDKGVRMMQEGCVPQVSAYDEPHMRLPTYRVDTTQGYRPSLETLKQSIFSPCTEKSRDE